MKFPSLLICRAVSVLILCAVLVGAAAARHNDQNSPLPSYGVTPGKTAHDKCGLRHSFEILRDWRSFSTTEQQAYRAFFAPPSTQTERVIGHFAIYYDTTGSNAPALITIDSSGNPHRIPGTVEAFVDSVGKFFNYAWDYEIGVLGYSPPPVAVDGTYSVFIQNFGGSGLYGETMFSIDPIDPGPPARYATYIELDRDFQYVYEPTRGMPALKVTAAHEFHHSIQVGSYGTWDNDFYFYEITSTWMEDVVFGDVNDYYQYLRGSFGEPTGQFATPEVSFSTSGGLIEYSRAIWGKFIEKRFGRDLMRRTWDVMKHLPSIPSIDSALRAAGSSFPQAFVEWSEWNSHTGPVSDSVDFYTESRQYPPIARRQQIRYTAPGQTFSDSIAGMSSVYRGICLPSSPSAACDTSPEVLVIVSNVDMGASDNGIQYKFSYDIAGSGDTTYKKLSNGLYVRLSTSNPSNWATVELVPAVSGVPEAGEPRAFRLGQNYPNPFNPTTRIPFDLDREQRVTLRIYTLLGQEIATLVDGNLHVGKHEAIFRGEGLSSGVYLYRLSAGAQTVSKLMVLIR